MSNPKDSTDVSSIDIDAGNLSDGISTRSKRSTPLVLANDKVNAMDKDIKKLYKQQDACTDSIKELTAVVNNNNASIAAVLKKLEDIEKASSNSTSASVPLTNQSADVLNTVDRQGDEIADDSLFIQSTPLTSRTMLSGLASTTVHKRRHHYISDDSSNEYTSDDTDDDSGATRMDSKRRSKNQKRASLTIRQARIRAIQKMHDDDMKLFNPALPKHGKAVDAPDIKSVQVIRNCIATMTQLAVQYLDSESARSAVKYLGQLDSL
jgi:chromosome segregation ATPase